MEIGCGAGRDRGGAGLARVLYGFAAVWWNVVTA